MKKTRKKTDGSFGEKNPGIFCDITSVVRSPCCTILESISDGVFTIDTEKRITSFNRAAESITGFTQEEAVGQFCFDVFRADICAKNCALEKTFSSKEPQIDFSAQIITRHGEEKPISLSTNLLCDAEGRARAAFLLPAKQLRYLFVIVMFHMGLKMCGVFAWLVLPL